MIRTLLWFLLISPSKPACTCHWRIKHMDLQLFRLCLMSAVVPNITQDAVVW